MNNRFDSQWMNTPVSFATPDQVAEMQAALERVRVLADHWANLSNPNDDRLVHQQISDGRWMLAALDGETTQ